MDWTKIRLNGLSTVDLPIVDALPSDPYILKSADGLGPPVVDVSIVEGYYQGRRPQNREIVLLVGLNPDYTVGQKVSDLRTSLYGMLTPGYTDNVMVEIMDIDGVLVQTVGYVSKLEIAPFSKDPAVQITIPCLEKYLQAPSVIYVVPEGKNNPEITNAGTAPAGFRMEVVFSASMDSWVLSDLTGKKMQFDYGFQSGDTLIFDTTPGARGIWVLRSGITSNILYSLSKDSVWYTLYGGLNTFATSSQAFDWGDVYYRPQYWGV